MSPIKHQLFAATLLATSAVVPMLAQASDGTITLTLTGTLIASTCTVTAPASFSVALPSLTAHSLLTAGSVAGNTPFSLSVTGCPAGLTGASMYFEANANVDTTSGRLNNTGTATNAQFQLLNQGSSVIDLSKARRAQGATVATSSSSAVTVHYAVRYYAPAAETPGTVACTITHSMVYN